MEDNRIWLGMLDTDRLGRYYGRIADRMQRLHFYFTVGIVLSSSAAALSLLTQLPDLVSVITYHGRRRCWRDCRHGRCGWWRWGCWHK